LDWLIDLYNAYLKEQEALRLQIKADKRFELWQQNQLKKAEEETEALLKAEKQNAEMWWYCVSIVGIVVVSVAVVVVVVAVVSGK
jgi:t-SNARE complex subunit (syntaxin)